MSIHHAFAARIVDHTGEGTLTDGSILWEVVTPGGDRIASCESEHGAQELEMALNLALTDWVGEDEGDRSVDAK